MPVNKDFYTLAGSSGQSTGYEIEQSIRFNRSDNSYMSKSFGSAGDRKTYTFSWWQKRGTVTGSSTEIVFGTDLAFGNSADYLYFYNDKFYVWNQPTGNMMITNRLFRDYSAWYHFVLVHDSTQVAASERLRFYVNGERQTSFSTINYPSEDYASGYFNNNITHYIGGANTSTNRLGSYLTDIHFIDGYGYGPEFFGELDDSSNWIPKKYSGSYGSNGFKIDGRDSSDLGDDESGNGNDFSTSNMSAHDQVSDSPSNSFCVLNPLDNRNTPGTLSEGNLKMAFSATNDNVTGTFGISTGKWYWEAHIVDKSDTYIGVQDSGVASTGYTVSAVALWSGSYIYENNSDNTDRSTSYDNGDVVGVAFDADNKKIWWSKNGQWYSADDSSANQTINISEVEAGNQAQVITRSPDFFMPFFGNYTHSTAVFNFGQEGTFAGNETAGGNSDGNGIGNFFSTVPSGFLALCTKNFFSSGG